MSLSDILTSPFFHALVLPAAFVLITFSAKMATRVADLAPVLHEVLQFGIDLCVAILAIYTAFLIGCVRPGTSSTPVATDLAVSLVFLLVGLVVCVAVQGFLYAHKWRAAETFFSDVWGFIVFGAGSYHLMNLVGASYGP